MLFVQMLDRGRALCESLALQRGCRVRYALRAAGGDVAVGFVPPNGALQGSFYRAGAETQFALGSRAINKHFVARDFHALDGDLRLAKCEPRKKRIGVNPWEGEAVGNLHAGGAGS